MASQLLVSTPYSAWLFLSTLFYWNYCPFPLSSNDKITASNNRLGDTCCDVTKSLHQTIVWVTHAVTWLVIYLFFISGTVQDNEILHTHSNHKNGPHCKLLWLSIRNLVFCFVFCPLSCILQVELVVIIRILCQTRTVKLSAIWAFCLCATGEFICLGILKGLTPWKCLCMFCFMDSMEFTGDRQFPQYL